MHSRKVSDRPEDGRFHNIVIEARLVTTVVVTCIPSPYQVELFDELAKADPGFRAVYVWRRHASRRWDDPELRHPALFLDEAVTSRQEFFHSVESAELVVFADYSSLVVREAMRRRDAIGAPWCFWGERPGYHGLGALGRVWRQINLRPLHRGVAPIWGIGNWAIGEYRREFGDRRLYFNMPYFSDLNRFRAAASARRTEPKTVRLLYSGALITRKGVDLLARAFRRLGRDRGNVTLSVIGTGPLRATMETILEPFASRVHFHDFVPWHALPALYAQADILCAPSRYDGWGLIVPEGMAAGMPVIATDRVGAAFDLVEHEKNGWLIRAGDEDALYNAICEAVDLTLDHRMEMATAAQSSASQQHTTEGVRRFRRAAERTVSIWGT